MRSAVRCAEQCGQASASARSWQQILVMTDSANLPISFAVVPFHEQANPQTRSQTPSGDHTFVVTATTKFEIAVVERRRD